jgi:hypothetical protein
MKESEVKYIHRRPYLEVDGKDGKPVKRVYYSQACIAYTKPAGGKCVFAYARCNSKDNYNKKVGRAIALNRLLRLGTIIDVEPGKHIKTISDHVGMLINADTEAAYNAHAY